MFVVFANPSGWPDRMKVRDHKQLETRLAKLAAKGHPVTVLSVHHNVLDTWDAMLIEQRKFKEARWLLEDYWGKEE